MIYIYLNEHPRKVSELQLTEAAVAVMISHGGRAKRHRT